MRTINHVRPALLITCLATACGPPSASYSAAAVADTIVTTADSAALQLRLETVATGLEVPWDMAFTPDYRILLTERPGRVRVIVDGRLQEEPWARLEVFGTDPVLLPESGLMGIALAPDYEQSRHVYVMATVHTSGNSGLARNWTRVTRRVRRQLGLANESLYESRIYRFTDNGMSGFDAVVIMGGLPASYYHAGGALRFGPDGMLYFTVGDIIESQRAQDPAQRVGIVGRIRPDGTVPDDNPIAGSPVFAFGLRNTQGLIWDDSGQLWGIEHGPSMMDHEEGRYGHDELNAITPGGNYGWPAAAGRAATPGFIDPLLVWMPGIAPGGLTLYTNGLISQWDGSFLVGGLRSQQLRRVTLDTTGGGHNVLIDDTVLTGLGRIRAVHTGPDGALYITTSNQDGRGEKRPEGDRLIRLTPYSGDAGREDTAR